MTPEDRKRQSAIISKVYGEWAAEQRGTFEPDHEYAANDPTQYAEHADLMTAKPDAQQDLLERTSAALAEAGLLSSVERSKKMALVKRFAATVIDLDTDSLVASGWRDQLRIPKGNQERSGRWTFTPWKHLDDVVGLLNALGPDTETGTRATVQEALRLLSPYDPTDFDPNDPELKSVILQVADLLDQTDPSEDESLNDTLRQAAQGVRQFADADWTLFAEDTDLDREPVSAGRATNKSVWDGDIPGDEAVNPDLGDKSSQWLVDELLRIKNHPVAPSPTARRKRAMYLKELNDRRDRDSRDPEEVAHEKALKDIGFKRPTREQVDAANAYVWKIQDLPEVREEDSEFPIHFGVAAEDSEENAVDEAVDRGFANKAGNRYGAKEPVTDQELDDWVAVRTAANLEGVLDGAGYDRDGTLYDFNQPKPDDWPTIVTSGHNYGTASVDVEDGPPYTGTSREAGTPYTIQPSSYYVEDENDYGYRNKVTVMGRPLKNDGTPAARQVRLDIASNDVPDNVWEALKEMRPDLKRTKDSLMEHIAIRDDMYKVENGSDIWDMLLRVEDMMAKDDLPDRQISAVQIARRQFKNWNYGGMSDMASHDLRSYMNTIPDDDPWKETLQVLTSHMNQTWHAIQTKEYRLKRARTTMIDYMQQAFNIEARHKVPSQSRGRVGDLIGAIRGQMANELQADLLSDTEPIVNPGDDLFSQAQYGLYENDRDKFYNALERLNELVKFRPEGEHWKSMVLSLNKNAVKWEQFFGEDPDLDSPELPKIIERLQEADNTEDLAVELDALQDLALKLRAAGFDNPFANPGYFAYLARLQQAAKGGDAQTFSNVIANYILPAIEMPNVDEKWKAFAPVFRDLSNRWVPEFEAAAARVQKDMEAKFGVLPEEDRTPEAIVRDIGMFYPVRRGATGNCVLATAAYELRRRGIDVHPLRAKDGRSEGMAFSMWMTGAPNGTNVTNVDGLKGLRAKNRYRVIAQHILDNYPAGSRGYIAGGWKNINSGHIWNWEIDEDGDLKFWDAQPGIEVTPDTHHWQDIDWKHVRVARLDDRGLKPDIEVAVAQPEHTNNITPEVIAVSRQMQALRAEKRVLFEQMKGMKFGDPGYMVLWNQVQPLTQEIARLQATPEGKRLAEIAHDFPILGKEKNTL